jgi:hypothetical protein
MEGQAPGLGEAERSAPAQCADRCDYCGAESIVWRMCKLICLNCGNIVRSCADL